MNRDIEDIEADLTDALKAFREQEIEVYAAQMELKTVYQQK